MYSLSIFTTFSIISMFNFKNNRKTLRESTFQWCNLVLWGLRPAIMNGDLIIITKYLHFQFSSYNKIKISIKYYTRCTQYFLCERLNNTQWYILKSWILLPIWVHFWARILLLKVIHIRDLWSLYITFESNIQVLWSPYITLKIYMGSKLDTACAK